MSSGRNPLKALLVSKLHRRKQSRLSRQTNPDAGPISSSPATSTEDGYPPGTPMKAIPDRHIDSDCPEHRPKDCLLSSPESFERSSYQEPTPPSTSEPRDSPVLDEPEGSSKTHQTTDQYSGDATKDTSTAKPKLNSTPSFTPEDCAAWRWGIAYDRLMKEKPELRDRYELAVSSYIANGSQPGVTSRRSSDTSSGRNCASLGDRQSRQRLMERCLDTFLREPAPSVSDSAENGDDVDRGIDLDRTGEAGNRPLKGILREAVRRSRHASHAWVASCLTLESLLLHRSPPDAPHSGAIPLLAKMEWYIGLSKLVLPDHHYGVDESLSTSLEPPLEILVQLYKAILSYQVSIVCCLGCTIERPHRPPVDPFEFKQYESDVRTSEQALAGFYGLELETALTRTLSETVESEKEGVTVHNGSSKSPDDTTQYEKLLERLEVAKHPSLESESNNSPTFGDLYKWARSTPEYKRFVAWGVEPSERVLWVDGARGTGKTKLLQAAVQGLTEIEDLPGSVEPKKVAYYFYDTTRPRYGNALAAVKSLIYHILKSQPDLYGILEHKFDTTERENFNDPNDFYAMSLVLFALISDEDFQSTYFVLDAIEELTADVDIGLLGPDGRGLSDLVTLISETVKVSDKVRWLVSLNSDKGGAKPTLAKEDQPLKYDKDRVAMVQDWYHVLSDGSLRITPSPGSETSPTPYGALQLRLTIKPDLEDVRTVARSYATFKFAGIAEKAHYKNALSEKIIKKTHGAPSNLLWLNMALDIVKTSPTPWNAPEIMEELKAKTPSVYSMYGDREDGINTLREHDKIYCRDALHAAAIAYRPLLVPELEAILNLPPEVDLALLVRNVLAPFLEVSEDEVPDRRRVLFVHSSARAFIWQRLKDQGLTSKAHSRMTTNCLEILLSKFNCDSRPIDRSATGLGTSLDYAAIFWIRHLSELDEDDEKAMDSAMHVIYSHAVDWLELLDSRNLLVEALTIMAKLGAVLTAKSRGSGTEYAESVHQKILDVSGFLKAHQHSKTTSDVDDPSLTDANEKSWVSPKNTLLFYPSRTPLRRHLLAKYYPWLTPAPKIEPNAAALSSSLHVMSHPDYVRACAFSPNAGLVISASDDERVRLWDVETGKLQHVLEGPQEYVYSLAVSGSGPDGRAILAASDGDTIWLWELYTGRVVGVLREAVVALVGAKRNERPADRHGDEFDNKNEHSDDKEENDEGEFLRDQAELNETRQALDVASISMTKDGTRLAAATGSKVIVWDIPSFKETVWEDNEGEPCRCVRFSNDGRLLASSAGAAITIWDATTGDVLHRLPRSGWPSPDEGSTSSVASPGDVASADGKSETKSSGGKTLKEGPGHLRRGSWLRREAPEHRVPGDEADVKAQVETPHWAAGHSKYIDGLAFSPDDKHLASGSDDATARVWDINTGATLAVLQYHDGEVNSVSFSADGSYLATGSADKTIAIWKRQSPDGWSCSTTLRQPYRILRGHTRAVWSVAFSPEGSFLASSGSDGDLRVWDTQTFTTEKMADNETAETQLRDDGSPLSTSPGPGHKQKVTCVTMSPNGETIASASSDGVICLWNGNTGVRRCTMTETHGGKVTVLVFSPDSAQLISASVDYKAFVWDVSVGSSGPRNRLEGHDDWIRGAAVSPTGRLIATASDDRTIRVWDIAAANADGAGETGSERGVPFRVFSGHQDWIYSVAFSPDGSRLASAGDDSQVMIWDLAGQGNKDRPDRKLADQVDEADPDSRVPSPIRALVFLADSRRVLTKSANGAVVVWNSDAPQEKPCLLVEDERAWTSLRFDKDHPDVLLTRFGAWPFKISKLAPENVVAREARIPRRDVPPPSWAPVGVSADGSWITWKNQKIIFLPRELRRRSEDKCWVQGHRVVLGCRSGQVLLFGFSE